MTKRIILILSIVIFPLATFAEISKDDENSVKKCDEFVYKTNTNSKDEILKIVNSGIY